MTVRSSNIDSLLLVAFESPTVLYFWWLIGTRDHHPPALHVMLFVAGLAVCSVLTVTVACRGKTIHRGIAAVCALPLAFMWAVLAWDFLK